MNFVRSDSVKLILGVVGVLALIVLVLVLVLKGFKGSQPTYATPLTDYSTTNSQVSLTVDGPVVAEQNHSSYRITVDRNNVTIETIQGYENRVVDTKTYSNNQASFYSFLRALDIAGFTSGKEAKTDSANDERGVCASGDRYVFELINDGSDLQRYWASSCGSGTFKGNSAKVRQLFSLQVPDFDQLTTGLTL